MLSLSPYSNSHPWAKLHGRASAARHFMQLMECERFAEHPFCPPRRNFSVPDARRGEWLTGVEGFAFNPFKDSGVGDPGAIAGSLVYRDERDERSSLPCVYAPCLWWRGDGWRAATRAPANCFWSSQKRGLKETAASASDEIGSYLCSDDKCLHTKQKPL